MNGYVKPRFSIIRSRNDLHVAETVNGKRVYRQEQIFFPQLGRFVKTAPYDNHFTFEDNTNIGWTLFCTCGSPAVIVGFRAYEKDASPTSGLGIMPGELLVCYHHASFNKHLDGSS